MSDNLKLGITVSIDGTAKSVKDIKRIDKALQDLAKGNANILKSANALQSAYDFKRSPGLSKLIADFAALDAQAREASNSVKGIGSSGAELNKLGTSIKAVNKALSDAGKSNKLSKQLVDILATSKDVDATAKRLKDAFNIDDKNAKALAITLSKVDVSAEDAAKAATQLQSALNLDDKQLVDIAKAFSRVQQDAEKFRSKTEEIGKVRGLDGLEKAIRGISDSLKSTPETDRIAASLTKIQSEARTVADLASRLRTAFNIDDTKANDLAVALDKVKREGGSATDAAQKLKAALNLDDNQVAGLVNSFKNVATQIDRANKEASLLARTLNTVSKGFQLAVGAGSLDAAVNTIKNGVSGLTGIVSGAVKDFGSLQAALIEFDAKSQGTATAELLEEIKQQAFELAAITSQDVDGVAELATGLLTLGASAESIPGSLRAITLLADSLGENPLLTGKVVQTGITIFGKFGETSDSIADKIQTLINSTAAGSTGGVAEFFQLYQQAGAVAADASINFEQLGSAFATARDAGISQRVAATGLRNVIQNLVPTSEAAKDALKEIGVSLFENGEFIDQTSDGYTDFGAIIGKFAGALEGLTTEERIEKLKTLFGAAGAGTIAALTQQYEAKYIPTLGRVSDAQGAVEENIEKVNQGFLRQVGILAGNLNALSTIAGEALAPVATATVGALIETVDKLTKQSGDIFAPLTESGTRFAEVLGEANIVSETFTSLIGDSLSSVVSILAGQLDNLSNVLANNPEALNEFAEGFLEFAGNVGTLILSFGSLTASVGDVVTNLGGGLVGTFNSLTPAIVTTLEFVDLLVDALGFLTSNSQIVTLAFQALLIKMLALKAVALAASFAGIATSAISLAQGLFAANASVTLFSTAAATGSRSSLLLSASLAKSATASRAAATGFASGAAGMLKSVGTLALVGAAVATTTTALSRFKDGGEELNDAADEANSRLVILQSELTKTGAIADSTAESIRGVLPEDPPPTDWVDAAVGRFNNLNGALNRIVGLPEDFLRIPTDAEKRVNDARIAVENLFESTNGVIDLSLTFDGSEADATKVLNTINAEIGNVQSAIDGLNVNELGTTAFDELNESLTAQLNLLTQREQAFAAANKLTSQTLEPPTKPTIDPGLNPELDPDGTEDDTERIVTSLEKLVRANSTALGELERDSLEAKATLLEAGATQEEIAENESKALDDRLKSNEKFLKDLQALDQAGLDAEEVEKLQDEILATEQSIAQDRIAIAEDAKVQINETLEDIAQQNERTQLQRERSLLKLEQSLRASGASEVEIAKQVADEKFKTEESSINDLIKLEQRKIKEFGADSDEGEDASLEVLRLQNSLISIQIEREKALQAAAQDRIDEQARQNESVKLTSEGGLISLESELRANGETELEIAQQLADERFKIESDSVNALIELQREKIKILGESSTEGQDATLELIRLQNQQASLNLDREKEIQEQAKARIAERIELEKDIQSSVADTLSFIESSLQRQSDLLNQQAQIASAIDSARSSISDRATGRLEKALELAKQIASGDLEGDELKSSRRQLSSLGFSGANAQSAVERQLFEAQKQRNREAEESLIRQQEIATQQLEIDILRNQAAAERAVIEAEIALLDTQIALNDAIASGDVDKIALLEKQLGLRESILNQSRELQSQEAANADSQRGLLDLQQEQELADLQGQAASQARDFASSVTDPVVASAANSYATSAEKQSIAQDNVLASKASELEVTLNLISITEQRLALEQQITDTINSRQPTASADSVTALRDGGPVSDGGLYKVHKDEYFVPSQNGTILNQAASRNVVKDVLREQYTRQSFSVGSILNSVNVPVASSSIAPIIDNRDLIKEIKTLQSIIKNTRVAQSNAQTNTFINEPDPFGRAAELRLNDLKLKVRGRGV